MPEPYHALLVHKTDMTSTLEKFHGEALHIEVLARHVRENEYYREVVLVLNGSKKRVEFGAIKIILDLFPMDAQQEILREQQPLGRILSCVQDSVLPAAPALSCGSTSDKFIDTRSAIGRSAQCCMAGGIPCWMRWDRPLAEIVEILPP